MGTAGGPGSAADLSQQGSGDSSGVLRVVLEHDIPSKDVRVLPYDVNDKEQLDQYPAHGTPVKSLGAVPAWKRLLWEGGTPFDAFLTAASAQMNTQVGQVILNLPNSMAKAGLALGVVFQVTAATVAVYTLWLLSTLYLEFKRAAIKDNTWYNDASGTKRTRITQYHSIITATTGRRWLGEFSRVVNIAELVGLAVAQIIASASNFYSLGSGLNKRTWTLILGGVALPMVLVPSFRNMRMFALLALLGTTYTSWYMMITSWSHGLQPGAASKPPGTTEDVFAALSNIIFTFGGHCMLLEVLDSQWRPSKFPKTFSFALLYVTSTLTLPNAAFTFLAFPERAYEYGNAFAIFPKSPAKVVGIVLMVAHQLVAYGLFILPVCIMWEKLWRVHYKANWIKLPVRLPVGMFVWLVALAIPFFGVINDIMGAFCVTFETYIIPPLAFNLYYQRRPDRQANSFFNPRWLGWTGVFVLNYIIIATTLVAGLGFGGYASVVGLIESVGKFGVFAACYNC